MTAWLDAFQATVKARGLNPQPYTLHHAPCTLKQAVATPSTLLLASLAIGLQSRIIGQVSDLGRFGIRPTLLDSLHYAANPGRLANGNPLACEVLFRVGSDDVSLAGRSAGLVQGSGFRVQGPGFMVQG